MDEEGDIREIDLVALPSKPSVVTDEECRSNAIPRDIPGRVEVFTNRYDDDWDSSDEEPLEIKIRKGNFQEPR